MKRQVLLSVLAAIAIFAVTTTAQAGMFGRLSVIRGCAPCEPACCEPCEPACCEPCVPACEPCEPVCCDTGCGPCGHRPFRPFGGFFLKLRSKWAYKGCNPCGEVACCEPVCEPCVPACEPVCEPCVPACEPVCEPCEPTCCDVGCGPCGKRPFLPFGGFFLKLRNKMAYKMASCGPCCEVSCEPCEPACCEPCHPCN